MRIYLFRASVGIIFHWIGIKLMMTESDHCVIPYFSNSILNLMCSSPHKPLFPNWFVVFLMLWNFLLSFALLVLTDWIAAMQWMCLAHILKVCFWEHDVSFSQTACSLQSAWINSSWWRTLCALVWLSHQLYKTFMLCIKWMSYCNTGQKWMLQHCRNVFKTLPHCCDQSYVFHICTYKVFLLLILQVLPKFD